MEKIQAPKCPCGSPLITFYYQGTTLKVICHSCRKDYSNSDFYCPRCGEKIDIRAFQAHHSGRRRISFETTDICANCHCGITYPNAKKKVRQCAWCLREVKSWCKHHWDDGSVEILCANCHAVVSHKQRYTVGSPSSSIVTSPEWYCPECRDKYGTWVLGFSTGERFEPTPNQPAFAVYQCFAFPNDPGHRWARAI